MAARKVTPTRIPVRAIVWAFHILLPLLGLWLLLEHPQLDGRWEHHTAHFWLVLLAALVNVGLSVGISRAAQHRGDARLFVVSLAFLVSAGFLGLHALATPGVLLDRNAGFVVATPVGLLMASVLAVVSSTELGEASAGRILGWQRGLRSAALVLIAAWGVLSLAEIGPLRRPLAPSEAHGPLVSFAVAGVFLYAVAAARYWQVYRRQPSVMGMSVITAFVLLAEAMVAIAWARNWHTSWWEWHVLMTAAFAFVAYSALVQYRFEGSSAGLFDSISLSRTVAQIRAEYGDALEALVAAMHDGGSTTEAAVRVAGQFGLTERQRDVLVRAAEALASEREHLRRQGALVALGQQTSVIAEEGALLERSAALVADAFRGDVLVVAVHRGDGVETIGADGVGSAGRDVLATGAAVEHADALALPLTVKGNVAGVLEARRAPARPPFADRDKLLLQSFAHQLSVALENARLYRQLDGLFRSYMSPGVATALLANPEQAALGGEVREVTVLFADLRGYTSFAERTPPDQVVALLNRYYGTAVPIVLAEGGTLVQFVGDALMALFNAPVLQPDHAVRAGRAGLALQEAITELTRGHGDWPRFRVGINSGPALVGNIGSAEMRNFTAIGDTTNLAARLEASAGAGQVVIGDATLRLMGACAVVEPLEPLILKGKSEPVAAYVLTRVL